MKKIQDLRFNLTEDMNNMMIELLITQQMLKDDRIYKEDKILLENHKQELMKEFMQEFKKNNKKRTYIFMLLIILCIPFTFFKYSI